MNNYNKWLTLQSDNFKNEVGKDLKKYWKQPITLQQLQELDNQHILADSDTQETL